MSEFSDIYGVLSSCSIFYGLPENRYDAVLDCLQAYRKHYSRDETILNIGDSSRLAGVVLSGTVEMALYDEGGKQNNVNHIGPGAVFGAERACCDTVASPLCLRAVTSCEVLFLNFINLLQSEPGCPYCGRVTQNLLRDFARQTQFLNLKLHIMGQKHLRDKLKIYLQTLECRPDGSITLPFNRRELAEFLYADRSALSRELCRLRDEGILTFEGNDLRILDSGFLAG